MNESAPESSRATDIACALAASITGMEPDADPSKGGEWFNHLRNMLTNQSSDDLEFFRDASAGFNSFCWKALEQAISDYIYGGPVVDSSFGDDEVEVTESFFLRLAFTLIPLVVEEHLPMLAVGEESLMWNGSYTAPDEEEMDQAISNAINWLAVEMVSDGHSLEIAKGLHLCRTFTDGEEEIAHDTLLWMSENAMIILENARRVFSNVFDFELAKEIVRIQAPVMRSGAL